MTACTNYSESRDGYNIRSRHPERLEYYEEFKTLSRQTRSKFPNIPDIRYGENERQVLDVFLTDDKGPAAIFIHGGFWQAHDKREFSFVAAPFVEAGVTTIMINYSRAPAQSISALIGEVRASCSWLYQNAETYAIDLDRIHVYGHSAGAHLAAAALFTNWNELGLPDNFLKSGCFVSGMFDLAPLCTSQVGRDLKLNEATASTASPIRMASHNNTSILIDVGADETKAFIDQSLHMTSIAQELGIKTELKILQDMNHYDTLLALGDCKGVTVRRALEIIL
jgi:arylformamidase